MASSSSMHSKVTTTTTTRKATVTSDTQGAQGNGRPVTTTTTTTTIITHKPLPSFSIDEMADEIAQDIMQFCINEIAFEVHKTLKMGQFCLNCDGGCQSDFVQKSGYDLFGQPIKATINETFTCAHCKRSVVASRYAPHLEKCMGLGRNSSRIATRRMNTAITAALMDEDDSFGEEWTEETERRPKRARTKKTKQKKAVPPVDKQTALAALKSMPIVKLKELFENTCGVLSPTSGRLCSKSLKCPQHTDAQRYFIRKHFLAAHFANSFATNAGLDLRKLGIDTSKDSKVTSKTTEESMYVDVEGDEDIKPLSVVFDKSKKKG